MMYLKELGFDEKTIEIIEKELPENALTALKNEKERVSTNINCLINLGIENYIDAFVRFYNMFLLDTTTFDEIFSKYDREDLIAKLEKNVAIMEYL